MEPCLCPLLVAGDSGLLWTSSLVEQVFVGSTMPQIAYKCSPLPKKPQNGGKGISTDPERW